MFTFAFFHHLSKWMLKHKQKKWLSTGWKRHEPSGRHQTHRRSISDKGAGTSQWHAAITAVRTETEQECSGRIQERSESPLSFVSIDPPGFDCCLWWPNNHRLRKASAQKALITKQLIFRKQQRESFTLTANSASMWGVFGCLQGFLKATSNRWLKPLSGSWQTFSDQCRCTGLMSQKVRI